MRWPFHHKPKRPRYHPTPAQALEALQRRECMYRPVSNCTKPPRGEGLRDADDINEVLVCGAHYGRLRKMPERDLDLLERVLVEAFAPR